MARGRAERWCCESSLLFSQPNCFRCASSNLLAAFSSCGSPSSYSPKKKPTLTAAQGAQGMWRAIWLILVADLTMSIDNILAVAAASKGNVALLIFGLGLSIPFVIFTSTLLSRIMDRYPIVVYIGAAILGRVGGEMMISDPWIVNMLHPAHIWDIASQIFFAIAVLVVGKLLAARHSPKT